MKIVIDIEANGLENATKIWCVVTKDVDTGEYHVFRLQEPGESARLTAHLADVDTLIGHNLLGYDWPLLDRLLGFKIDPSRALDTLIISKLVDYPRDAHSIESYGLEFGLEKIEHYDFSKFSEDMVPYCRRDVDICHLIYSKYLKYISKPEHRRSIQLEHEFQLVCNKLHDTGFAFDTKKAAALLEKVEAELGVLDKDILDAFPPREILIREFTPKATKFGTISKASVPVSLRDRIHEYEIGKTYRHTKFEDFNPSSHKQIIQVLNEAGWKPTDKTKTHIELERDIAKARRSREKVLSELEDKLIALQRTGWKVNETNLETLPITAPKGAKLLAKRILLESRRRTLTEWLDLVTEQDSRIRGKFYGIGAWTHRMAHQAPNTANIPNEFDTAGKKKLYGKELRSMWIAPKNRLLVGVDAEGIQLRIFAHYIDDPEFTEALVKGNKDEKTDPHSLNQRILGPACKSRDAAKRYIFALLLGAGTGKLREILGCDEQTAQQALERLLERYTGFALLKQTIVPRDAKRGWFTGLDGRRVRIPGDTDGARRHLAMSGYLQNGEAVVMKRATMKWWSKLEDYDARLVNFVHDEWQTECPNNLTTALTIAKMQSDSLRLVGEELGLKCPLAGSYWNDKAKDYTIDVNWSKTH